MALDLARLQGRLDDLIKKHEVPGATLAVLSDGEITAVASGVVNINTGVEATTDSIFQIGSISKVYTATLIMQLVDEGKVSLDEPVITYLPDFRLADAELTSTVTVRHLLNHTSGIDGDFFIDLGRGDDVVERYVEKLAEVPSMAPLGALMSYCNSGFVLAGRIVEVLDGKTWDAAVRDRISIPFGLTHTGTLPEEAILYRTAAGHVPHPETGAPFVAPVWQLPRAIGPAGLINSTASDVVRFAGVHLKGGIGADDAQVLSSASAAAMLEPQIVIPEPDTLGSEWGVGWILFNHWLKSDGTSGKVYGHDGNTIGQAAFLRVAPEANVAICLLTNGGQTKSLFQELYDELLQELAGISLPAKPAAVERTVDLAPYLGVYERIGVRITFTEVDGDLHGLMEQTGEIELAPPQSFVAQPTAREGQFVTSLPGSTAIMPMSFIEVAGTPYIHLGVRATPKVS